jgi:hypothetical protein
MPHPPTLFISHSREDAELALALKQRLESLFSRSVEIFVSSDIASVHAASMWLPSVRAAIDRAALVVVLVSRQSLTRPWVNFEAGAAFILDKPILPACLGGLIPDELPIPFKLFQAVDLREEAGIRALFARVASLLPDDGPSVASSADYTLLARALGSFTAERLDWDDSGGVASALKHLQGTWRGSYIGYDLKNAVASSQQQSGTATLTLRPESVVPHGTLSLLSNATGATADVEPTSERSPVTLGVHGTLLSVDQREQGPLECIVRVAAFMRPYLCLEYRLQARGASHFGMAVLKVLGSGKHMGGFYLATDPDDDPLLFGQIGFVRQT